MAIRKNQSDFGDLDASIYQPSISRGMFTDREARKEYARLRRVANKRLERLEAAGYGESAVVRRYGLGFESMRGASETAVRERLGDVAAFLERKTSSVTGQRAAKRAFVETMQERGYDFVNMDNADQVGRFMEAAKKHYGNKSAFDSVAILRLYEEAEDNDMDPNIVAENFDYWMENMNQLKRPVPDAADYVDPFQYVEGTGKQGRESKPLTAEQRETRRMKEMKARIAKSQRKAERGGKKRRR